MPYEPLDNHAGDSIQTDKDIRRRLDDLEDEKKYDDLVKPVKLAIDLSVALSAPWEFHGEGSEELSRDSLENRAEKDATSIPTMPASSAREPGGVEAEVIAAFTNWTSEVYNCFSRYNGAMQMRLLHLKSGIDRLIKTMNSNARDDADNYYAEGIAAADDTSHNPEISTTLNATMNDFLEKKNHFLAFRHAHGLHRGPRYESSIIAFAMIAIICVVVETAVNGFMYAQASDLGLIGGWGVAAGLSTVIFSLSFVAGWVLTQKNAMLEKHQSVNYNPDQSVNRSPEEGRKYNWERSIIPPLRGWAGFLFLATTVLVVISLVCVYRDEASMLDPTSDVHPMTESLRRVAEFDLLPRADIEGVLLVFVNLAIMVIGIYKGYNHFDTVPGYRIYARELEAERRSFKEEIDRTSKELGVTGDDRGRYESNLRVVTDNDVDAMFESLQTGN